MQARWDAGQVGCRTGGMQEGGMKDRWEAGQMGCRTGGMQDRRSVGQVGCRTNRGMQARKDEGQEG